MKNVWWILLVLVPFFLFLNRNVEIKKIEFVNSVEDVKDSLAVMRDIFKSIPNSSLIDHCYIGYNDSLLHLNFQVIGKWNVVRHDKKIITALSNKYKCDFQRVFRLMEYLNNNFIFNVGSWDDIFVVKYKWKECSGSRAEDKRYIILAQDSNRIPEHFYVVSREQGLLLLKMDLKVK